MESASQRLSQELSHKGRTTNHVSVQRRMSVDQARSLESQSWSVVPGMFQELCSEDRPWVMEVACEHDSALATAVQNARNDPRAASRCALWNSADVGTNKVCA